MARSEPKARIIAVPHDDGETGCCLVRVPSIEVQRTAVEYYAGIRRVFGTVEHLRGRGRGAIRPPLKQLALAGDIVLLFADELESLTHPYLARAWAKPVADLRVEAPGQSQKIAMMGALDFVSRELTGVTSQTKRSADFIVSAILAQAA